MKYISGSRVRSLIRDVLREGGASCGMGRSVDVDETEDDTDGKDDLSEVTPPGYEGVVKGLKKSKSVDNPWAVAWAMKRKGVRPKSESRLREGIKKVSNEEIVHAWKAIYDDVGYVDVRNLAAHLGVPSYAFNVQIRGVKDFVLDGDEVKLRRKDSVRTESHQKQHRVPTINCIKCGRSVNEDDDFYTFTGNGPFCELCYDRVLNLDQRIDRENAIALADPKSLHETRESVRVGEILDAWKEIYEDVGYVSVDDLAAYLTVTVPTLVRQIRDHSDLTIVGDEVWWEGSSRSSKTEGHRRGSLSERDTTSSIRSEILNALERDEASGARSTVYSLAHELDLSVAIVKLALTRMDMEVLPSGKILGFFDEDESKSDSALRTEGANSFTDDLDIVEAFDSILAMGDTPTVDRIAELIDADSDFVRGSLPYAGFEERNGIVITKKRNRRFFDEDEIAYQSGRPAVRGRSVVSRVPLRKREGGRGLMPALWNDDVD